MSIFISYRRKTGTYLAELISESLRNNGYKVFVDVHELKSGPFDQALINQIKNSEDFLLLITENLFPNKKYDPEDWVLQEVIEAYNSGKNIIPVLGQGALMPSEFDLPFEISKLSKENGIQYNATYSKPSIQKIISCLKSKPTKKKFYLLQIFSVLFVLSVFLFSFYKFKDNGSVKPPLITEDFDNKTLSERSYQDEFLKSKKDIKVLISEYKNKLEQNKESAIYHYLLARLYSFNKQKEEALKLALSGLKLDPSYIWNRRLLLYSSYLQDYDLDKLLEMEVNHYQISQKEQKDLVSGNPKLMRSSMDELKIRNQSKLIIKEDLDKFLCWHFFVGLNKLQSLDSSSFSGLVDKNVLSQGKTFRLKVLDVVNGISALKLLDTISHVRLPNNEALKNPSLRSAEDKQKVEDKQKIFLESFKFPPMAIKLNLSSNYSDVVLKNTNNRRFSLYSHMVIPNDDFMNFLFGKDVEIPKHNFVGKVHENYSDIKTISNYEEFWVFFNLYPLKNHNQKLQSVLYFDYDIELNGALKSFGSVHDNFYLSSFGDQNDPKTTVISIVDVLKDYYLFKKSFTDKLPNKNTSCTYQGTITKISKLSPGSFSINLNLLGNANHPIKLLVNSDVKPKKATAEKEDLNFDFSVGDVINFRGVVKEVNSSEMIINVLPLSIRKKDQGKPFYKLEQANKFVILKNEEPSNWKE